MTTFHEAMLAVESILDTLIEGELVKFEAVLLEHGLTTEELVVPLRKQHLSLMAWRRQVLRQTEENLPSMFGGEAPERVTATFQGNAITPEKVTAEKGTH